MAQYEHLVETIIESVGGKDNIENVTHCMTRLRFNLVDDELVNEGTLQKNPQIIMVQFSGGQLQVVIGTHVGDVYSELVDQVVLNQTKTTSKEEPKGLVNKFIETITKIITPTLGILIATSLVLGIQSLLLLFHLTNTTSGEYLILKALGNALFTFFPIVLGYTSAKAFHSDGFIGMIVGATLVFPSILTELTQGKAMYTLFSNTIFATPIYKTFFGIPIMFPSNGYTSTVIPIILAMFFISKLEKKLTTLIPKVMSFTLLPLITLIIGVPITILVFGPIANFASALITATIGFLYHASPILTAIVIGLFYQPLVLLGLHWPVVAIGINNLATQGFDTLLPMIYTVPFAQMAVVFAVYLRTKSQKEKSLCVPAMISTIFCIIEPAMYGITLPVKKRFAISCIASAVGAVIIAIFNVHNYASTIGLFGMVGFIDPKSGQYGGFLVAVCATLATLLVGFLLAYISFGKGENGQEKKL
ncbi:PTS transporter subunit EIIC [Vagococcus entomophilus]|uniref:PTS beta-glucoside transporter subunit EIIBCA n=1 Tax=Vagococcus entomophilus TaxID=1160095 RepID=A0A430AF86_9ENTE|nr:PTS transporter subunit EIIC [Vagococcus entomophilus]RSU06413.1 PTS beta-glucoside transporter subunit EIIBCA [Vagococcus entomophilus]